MFNSRTLSESSEIEDAFSSGEESAKYSDQVSSDLELELYNSLYHSNFNQNTGFNNTPNEDPSEVSNSVVNGFCEDSVTDKVSIVEKVAPTDIKTQVKRTLKSAKHSSSPLIKKSKRGVVRHDPVKVPKPGTSTNNDSDDSVSDDLMCVEEWGLSEDNLMTNLQGEVSYSSSDDGINTLSDNDIICLEKEPPINKLKKKTKQKFRPITIDLEYPSDSSSDHEKVGRSLPPKLQRKKLKKGETSNNPSESWHVDPEDKVISKKRSRRYHDREKCTNCRQDGHKAKFCPQAKNVKCYICGGSHISARCDKKVCSFCYQLGHQYQRCPNRYRVSNMQCEICKLMGHSFNHCPDLWRRFHATTTTDKYLVQSPRNKSDSGLKFCFNCGRSGHFGHQCQAPPSRVSCSPSWPYVVSYKYPKALLNARNGKSERTPNDRSSRKKAFRGTQRQGQGRSNHDSTPFASNFSAPEVRSTKKTFFKKRKLVFEEQNFQRTPKRFGNRTTDDLITPSPKKKLKKKRQRKRGVMDTL